MPDVLFVVPGLPRGKGRPRATRRGQGVRLYTDAKTANYEALVAAAAKAEMDGRDPTGHEVEVRIWVRMPIPKSKPKAWRKWAADDLVKPRTKPDLDNVAKAILDACNGITFVDDSQVTDLTVAKRYAAEPGVTVQMNFVKPWPTVETFPDFPLYT